MKSSGAKIAIVIAIVFMVSIVLQIKGDPDTLNAFVNEDLDVEGLPKIVDFGSDCPTCARMIPILNKIKKEYKDRLIVEMVNYFQNRDRANENNVMTTPTQIFYDVDGVEVYRHIGIFSVEQIKEKLAEMGVK